MNKPRVGQTGFTIVELLVVIVVIAVLAAVTVVAYGGVQAKGRDAARTKDIKQVQTAIELYYAKNGMYPDVGNDGWGYNITSLAPALTPNFMSKIPVDPKAGGPVYQYVRGTEASMSYGILVTYEAKTPCHLGVNNNGIGWWSRSAC